MALPSRPSIRVLLCLASAALLVVLRTSPLCAESDEPLEPDSVMTLENDPDEPGESFPEGEPFDAEVVSDAAGEPISPDERLELEDPLGDPRQEPPSDWLERADASRETAAGIPASESVGNPSCQSCSPEGDRVTLRRLLDRWDIDWDSVHSALRFRHSSTDGRHVGLGYPLMGTSWLNRPYHAGWFIGSFFGDSLIPGRVRQLNDFIGGYEMGWDFDHYWGTQLRLAWAAVPNENEEGEPFRRTGDVFLGDVSFLYYPWGDARVRPYAILGMGLANFDFVDDLGQRRDATLMSLPFGGGIKYQFRRWLALRGEVLDNFALGDSGVSAMHNASLTIGLEIHWGSDTTTYWPWNPGRHVW